MKNAWISASLVSISVLALVSPTAAKAEDQTQDLSGWKEVSSANERAYSAAEFAKLQIKYPTNFANVDPAQVTNAYIEFRNYMYMGTSVCPANDARLAKSTTEAGVCTLKNGCRVVKASPLGGEPCRTKK